MNSAPRKFFPRTRPESAAWWEASRHHSLLLQRCSKCGHLQFYPRIICAACTCDSLEWTPSAGRGRVSTFTICRRAVSEAYAADVPYVIALVQLDEGPTMMCNIVECDPESVTSDMPVEVCFEKWSEEITIPQFRPVPADE